MRVYIAVCSCRDWKPQFGASLCSLIHNASRASGLEIFLNTLQGTSVLPRARQLAIEDAINGGFTHILMIDDDMKFPPDLLADLIKHNVPMVGINYARKSHTNPTTLTCDLEGKNVSSKGKSGIEEVGWLGFGAVLIELSAIKDIPKPWFEMRWLPERADFMGEDFYFSMKARTSGVKLYVDHDVSNKCAHIGDFPYREV